MPGKAPTNPGGKDIVGAPDVFRRHPRIRMARGCGCRRGALFFLRQSIADAMRKGMNESRRGGRLSGFVFVMPQPSNERMNRIKVGLKR